MWQGAKTAIETVADRFGYAILPKWRLPNLDLADHLRQIFERYEIATVLDVGANAGQYAGFLRQEVGFNGLIVSIEPIPECFDALQRNAANDPNWIVVNAALGLVESEMPFNVMAYSVFSSFLEPKNDLVPGMAPLNQVQRRILVKVRRLDSLLAELEADRPPGRIYLKLDTQGFDLEVIKGAGTEIRHIRALQTDWQTAVAALRQYGFEPSGFWAVARDAALKAVELDCVMVRPESCDSRHADAETQDARH
jgi:FkbM family methyltransferase